MKWLIVLVLFTTLAWAQPVPDLTVRGELALPTDVIKTVLVEGAGTTPALARHDAFRTAIELAMGVVIASETQVNNQRLVRDQSATYSQARISNFAVVYVQHNQGLYRTQMWVTVRSACDRGSYNCTN